MPENRYGCIK